MGCKPTPQKIPSRPYDGVMAVSVRPEVIEAIRSELRVEGGVLDILVSKVELNGAGVLAVVGELEGLNPTPLSPRAIWRRGSA